MQWVTLGFLVGLVITGFIHLQVEHKKKDAFKESWDIAERDKKND